MNDFTSDFSYTDLVEQLLEKAGLQNLPYDYRVEYVQKLTTQLQERMGLVLLDALSEEEAEEFMEHIEAGGSAIDLVQGLVERMPELKDRLQESVKLFIDQFLQIATTVKEKRK